MSHPGAIALPFVGQWDKGPFKHCTAVSGTRDSAYSRAGTVSLRHIFSALS